MKTNTNKYLKIISTCTMLLVIVVIVIFRLLNMPYRTVISIIIVFIAAVIDCCFYALISKIKGQQDINEIWIEGLKEIVLGDDNHE